MTFLYHGTLGGPHGLNPFHFRPETPLEVATLVVAGSDVEMLKWVGVRWECRLGGRQAAKGTILGPGGTAPGGIMVNRVLGGLDLPPEWIAQGAIMGKGWLGCFWDLGLTVAAKQSFSVTFNRGHKIPVSVGLLGPQKFWTQEPTPQRFWTQEPASTPVDPRSPEEIEKDIRKKRTPALVVDGIIPANLEKLGNGILTPENGWTPDDDDHDDFNPGDQ